MTTAHYLKLRKNIALNGDVALAMRELSTLYEKVILINKIEEVFAYVELPKKLLSNHIRKKSPIGIVGLNPRKDIEEIVRLCSFIQEVWFAQSASAKLPEGLWYRKVTTLNGGNFVCAFPLMAAAEMLICINGQEVSLKDFSGILDAISSDIKASPRVEKAISRMLTSTPHVHGIHRYKAKFFPRMIRSFLVGTLYTLPKQDNERIVLLDPFVGSGTALVEASFIGVDSVGIDIDPLSCAISNAKIDLMNIDVLTFRKAVSDFKQTIVSVESAKNIDGEYVFPPWISKKFDAQRKSSKHDYTPELRKKYEREIAVIRKAISREKSQQLRKIYEICLSDAISKKFNIRMMGTGVGRFALEIRDTPLLRIVDANLSNTLRAANVCSVLKQAYGIKLAPSKVINDTATKMPLKDGTISVILTSPPYLPASSGREDYLIGKSISITALGLMTSEQIREGETKSVGSMRTNGNGDSTKLPPEVHELYSWLKKDELRNIKAEPTIAYYQSLLKSLRESHRVLSSNGVAIYVIGKESVFYNFSTRKVLYRVACDDIFEKMAKSCGFKIEARVDVELDKKNTNARPRSLDTYYETTFILRK